MSMITFDMLTDGQKNAFQVIVDRIRAGKHTTVRGPAGTGKTTLMRFIVQEFARTGEMGVLLATPTHQAKKVITKATMKQAFTLCSILRINPTNVEDTQVFEQKDTPKLANFGIIIVDEASMVGRKLFNILMKSIHSRMVIVGVGDFEQLRPVEPGENPEVSPFFTDPQFEQVELTEIKRSNAPIIDIATEIRKGGWVRPHSVGDAGVFQHTGETALRDLLTRYFSVVKKPEDLFENRILAFTNKSVEQLNRIVRRKLYNTEEPVIDGEVLVMQEPYVMEKQDPETGKKLYDVIYNNGELIRVKKAIKRAFNIKCNGYGKQIMVDGYELHTESVDGIEEKAMLNQKVGLDNFDDSDDTNDVVINIITDDDERSKMVNFLGEVAGHYREMKAKNLRPDWRSWWAAKRMFLNVKALPASTIHKSQGVSVDNVYLYTPCMLNEYVDPQLAKQLLYVGVTRARYRVDYM